MRIGVTTFGSDKGRSGIGHYVSQLLGALPTCAPGDHIDVLAHPGDLELYCRQTPGLTAAPLCAGLEPPALNIAWHQVGLPLRCWRRGYDVLFIPAGNRRLPAAAPCPTVGTVHDLSSLHVPAKYDPARTFYIRRVLPALIRQLSQVITVSESSKRDIVAHAGVPEERVHVIPLGVDRGRFHPRPREGCAAEVKRRLGVDRPYVLYISRLEHPGKNHVGLIRAFDRLKARTELPHQLVLAGSDWTRAEEIHDEARRARCRDDIVFTGFIPGDLLPALYGAADVFAFPSRYEGFGLPILEAMACGVPVVCSGVSSMPEVAGDAALLFDPADEGQLLDALTEALTNEDVRRRCVERGLARQARYSWETVARQTVEVLNMAAERGGRLRGEGRT